MQIPAALKVITYPKILLLRCKLRVELLKNPSLRSLDPKIQSQLMRKLPFRPALMNQGRLLAKIRKSSILRKSRTRKTLLQPQGTTPLRVRKSKMIEAIKSAIIVKKKAILLGTARKLQETSIGLSNFYAGDW